MKKYCLDLRVSAVERLSVKHVLLKLTQEAPLPAMQPGQFVEVRVDHSPSTFLRRPISIHYVDVAHNELWLLVATIGDGTRQMGRLQPGDEVNCLLPLGNGFSMPQKASNRVLLVGGGVGIAPLLYLGKILSDNNIAFEYLIGAKSKSDLLELDLLEKLATVNISTDNCSAGEKGLITHNSCLDKNWARIYCCGPAPMMKAIAKIAHQRNIDCEVSLENMMACGLGACLCCVEKTVKGNVCVCTEGPIFNIKDLTW